MLSDGLSHKYFGCLVFFFIINSSILTLLQSLIWPWHSHKLESQLGGQVSILDSTLRCLFILKWKQGINSVWFNCIGQISQTTSWQKGLGFGLPSTNVSPEQLQMAGNAKDENLACKMLRSKTINIWTHLGQPPERAALKLQDQNHGLQAELSLSWDAEAAGEAAEPYWKVAVSRREERAFIPGSATPALSAQRLLGLWQHLWFFHYRGFKLLTLYPQNRKSTTKKFLLRTALSTVGC